MAASRGAARRWAVGVLAAVAVVGLVGCEPATQTSMPSATSAAGSSSSGTASSGTSASGNPSEAASSASSAATRGTALAALGQIPVKGRAPKTGYDRELFGPAWSDTDHNGCDTRNDVLARDLTGVTFRPGTHDCIVVSGTLADPYSGKTIPFRRGQGTSEAVQIDHVVALSDAWQKGAQAWDTAKRTAFANDPLELLAVDGPLNQQKSDGDAATWLPPNRGYRCAYVARQVAVKLDYGLWMTQAEKDAIAGILATCPDQPLPGGSAAPVTAFAPAPAPPPAPSPAPAPAPAPAAPAQGGVYYANCTAARAAGAAPLHRGDPGYRSALDRDNDGVACE